MAETYTLDAEARTIVGKKVKQLRRQGLVPAIIYGAKIEPVNVQVAYRPLQVALMKAGGTHLIDVTVDGNTHTVLAREVQRDVVHGDIIHVDFLAVDVNTPIATEVPIHFTGEAPAVEERIGILTHGINKLSIEALPRDLVGAIEVDITGLKEIGDSIHVRDIVVSDKLKILADEEELIARVAPIPTVVEEEEVTGEPTAAEPEVIGKGKEEEEEEE